MRCWIPSLVQIHRLRDALEEKDSTGQIVNLLLMAQPLTAKQIYYKLKARYGLSAGYQAVHKHLCSLVEDGILRKDSLEYSVEPAWLDTADQLIGNMRDALKRRERVIRALERKPRRFKGEQARFKVISFDLGGALFDNHYDELLWRTEIPRKYAERYGISESEAFERVTAEYRRLWGKVDGWRDPVFWLNHFDIECTFAELTRDLRRTIQPYADALPLVSALASRYHLVIITSAQRNIIQQKLSAVRISNKFLKVYSTGEDFHKLTKDADIYREICEDLHIDPDELIHVGNKYEFDYLVPTRLGVRAFLIDRSGDRRDAFVVRDLYEFEEKIREAERDAESDLV